MVSAADLGPYERPPNIIGVEAIVDRSLRVRRDSGPLPKSRMDLDKQQARFAAEMTPARDDR
jgi:hypothetical protein